jgi:uncharacterized cupredoxin-like copper-binding protein
MKPSVVHCVVAIVATALSVQLSSAEAHDSAGRSSKKEMAHHGASGAPGDPAHVDRTVAITMSDAMRFDPSSIDAASGETIRFRITNAGALTHEFVLGMRDDLEKHAEMMKKMPGMEHHAANMATVRPGDTTELVWRFTRPGRVDFACLQPGHYEAGMRGDVRVSGGPTAHAGH